LFGNNFLQAYFIVSVWRGLVSIFKILHRTDLLSIFDKTYSILFPSNNNESGQHLEQENTENNKNDIEITTLRHLKTKLAQRLGLAILAPINCSWLYKRSKKSLQDNLMKYKDGNLLKTNVSTLNKQKAMLSTEEGLQNLNEGLDEDVD